MLPKSDPRFLMLLRQVAESPTHTTAEPSGGILVVPRRSGKRALNLLVRPASSGLLAKQYSSSPAALVLALDPELSVPATELREVYGLTGAEARLTKLLMDGHTLDDCCVHMGVSRLTVYSHLKRLFKKVGAQRQSELVSLLLRSVGVIGNASVLKSGRPVWHRYC
jgi:DNA-binding CsgD family transcriptional regulator